MTARLLIVDDDPVQRRLLEATTRRFGYEVETADGGEAALARLDAADKPPIHLLILDLVMPDLDGMAVLQRLRQSGNDVPVLFLTARDAVADRVAGLTAGGAKRRGIAAKSTTITQDYRPDFMLTTTPVTTTLVWSPVTRRILGAQFLSKHDISQAANVVSVAIQAGFTIDQLAGADLFFQPNFSQPINFVGAVAIQAVAES